jgi:putative phage-type endonuclease
MNVEILKPDNEAHWLEMRKADVTSTESAALFGLSPYTTRFELWHAKKSGIAREFQDNEAMEEGRFLEPGIAAWAAHIMGWEIEPLKSYWRRTDIRMGSSFDYVINNLPDGPAILEIKNLRYDVFKRDWIEHDDGFIEASEHIEVQVQHQLAVSGYKRAFICAKVGAGRPLIIERQRDEQVIAGLENTVREFWRTVDAGIEPPPMMPEDADAVIRMMRYAEPGKLLDASGDATIETLVANYKAACNERDNADEAAKVFKAELLVAIGDAEKVITSDWTISAGLVADTPPTVIDASMIGQSYGGRKGYRNLRVTQKKKAKAAA